MISKSNLKNLSITCNDERSLESAESLRILIDITKQICQGLLTIYRVECSSISNCTMYVYIYKLLRRGF